MAEINITSSLINDKDFVNVKDSLIEASKVDGKDKFRVKMLEYINDSSLDNDDKFFYDMLEFSRFLDPRDNDHVAFTTPDKLIYMNAPGMIGESVRQWDFIYDHECLHQLWDTFGVGDKIKKEKGSYDHMILNIASDCVINDYLSYYRKKEMPDDLVTPEYLKKNYKVDYDRTKDTQYTLYMKLLEKADEIKKDSFLQNNSKITPGGVEEVDVPQGGGPQPPQGKHSDDYIKGWKDGINDVTSGKVDPKSFKPKKPKNDYDKGYNDVMEKIKEGVENGIKIPKGGSPGQPGQNSDLPQIPWDVPQKKNQPQSGGGQSQDNQDSKDNQNKQNSNSQDSKGGSGSDSSKSDNKDLPKDASGAQKAADEAKKAAEEAKDAADKAKAKAKASGKAEDKEEADDAKAAADEARKAARDSQSAADKAKKAAKAGDKGKEQEAAEDAGRLSQKAKDEANKAKGLGDESKKGDDSSDKGNEKDDSSPKSWGDGHAEAQLSDADLKKIREKAEKVIEKYKNKISGDFGKFISQCTASVEMKSSGLSTGTVKGAASWKDKMDQCVNAFVKKKIFQKKREWQQTYSRVKRGSGFVKFGEPIEPGRKIKEEKLTINVAFYVDRSGSMSSSIDNVFKAVYLLADSMQKQFSRDQVVDKLSFKMYVFDTDIEEIPWKKRSNVGGGTMPFHQLMKEIDKRTKDYMINVILTDAQFDVQKAEVSKFVKGLGGMLSFITNCDNKSVEDVAKENKTNMFYILANSDFSFK